jgi:hypothetical protein
MLRPIAILEIFKFSQGSSTPNNKLYIIICDWGRRYSQVRFPAIQGGLQIDRRRTQKIAQGLRIHALDRKQQYSGKKEDDRILYKACKMLTGMQQNI